MGWLGSSSAGPTTELPTFIGLKKVSFKKQRKKKTDTHWKFYGRVAIFNCLA